MNENQSDTYITLDWDNISIDESVRRIRYILDNYSTLKRLELHFSPTKGFHCVLWFKFPVLVAKIRRALKDDGTRLVNDLLNRPSYVYNILWSRKHVQNTVWESKEILILVKDLKDTWRTKLNSQIGRAHV